MSQIILKNIDHSLKLLTFVEDNPVGKMNQYESEDFCWILSLLIFCSFLGGQ